MASKTADMLARGRYIYLQEGQTGNFTNLSNGNYNFTADAGDSLGRFEIVHEAEDILAVAASLKHELKVYSDGQDFVIASASKKITRLEVYDGGGRLVRDESPNHIRAVLEAAEMLPGMYILKITGRYHHQQKDFKNRSLKNLYKRPDSYQVFFFWFTP